VPPTDADLLARAAIGDGIAFELLYERHWQAVYRFAWLLARSVPDAEDITQECFLGLVRKPAQFDGQRSGLRTWLFAVARNQHLLRCRRRARQAGPEALELSEVPPGLVEEVIRMETAGAVRHAMDALPTAQREALYLFEFEGLSLADTAQVLGIEANAVKARLFRAREQLKRLLAHLRPLEMHTSEEDHAR
jgi:RNA polymerase sigma-70 factor (ECF subfamily)